MNNYNKSRLILIYQFCFWCDSQYLFNSQAPTQYCSKDCESMNTKNLHNIPELKQSLCSYSSSVSNQEKSYKTTTWLISKWNDL